MTIMYRIDQIMKRKTKHTTTSKDMLKTAVSITDFELSKIFELLKINNVQSYANKVKLFNFVLKHS